MERERIGRKEKSGWEKRIAGQVDEVLWKRGVGIDKEAWGDV